MQLTTCIARDFRRAATVFVLLLQTVGHGNQFANAGEDGLLHYYPCDEKSGTVLHDVGPHKKDGSLNAVINGEERGVSIVCKKVGEWVPIINADGIQRKGIVPGSDSALAEGERPIVLDRDKDYAIDTTSGLIKALEGGRVELDKPFTLDFKFSNPGSQWVEGKKSGGVKLDGVDDFARLGSLPSGKTLEAITLELWVFFTMNTSANTMVLRQRKSSKDESCLAMQLQKAHLQFVMSSNYVESSWVVFKQQWCHLSVTHDGTNVVLYLNGKETGRSSLPSKLDSSGDMFVGGTQDPQFLGAIVDEIKIYSRAKTAEEIAKDAAQ